MVWQARAWRWSSLRICGSSRAGVRVSLGVLLGPAGTTLSQPLPDLFPFARLVLSVDGLSAYFLLVISLVAAAAAIYGPSYLHAHAPDAGSGRQAQDSVDRNLEHDARHQRRDVTRGRGMSTRQPDMQRDDAGLDRKSSERQQEQYRSRVRVESTGDGTQALATPVIGLRWVGEPT